MRQGSDLMSQFVYDMCATKTLIVRKNIYACIYTAKNLYVMCCYMYTYMYTYMYMYTTYSFCMLYNVDCLISCLYHVNIY